MSYSKRSRYSSSPYYKYHSRSVSRSLSRSPSFSRSQSRSRYLDDDAENPGNNLYVTGLSRRVREEDLEIHFSSEGKVEDIHLVVDPWTRESRGFAFVTMSSLKDAERCIKYLNRSVLQGRVITVEKARRRRGRTPTPGKYLGLRTARDRRGSRDYSRSRSLSSERYRNRSRSNSPYYRRRRRSYSPYYRDRSYSPYSPVYDRGISYSRSVSRSPRSRSPCSPVYRYHSPNDRDYYYYNRRSAYRCSPDERRDYYYSRRSQRYRSISRSISPRRRRYMRSYTPSSVSPPRGHRRSYSRSVSPIPRKSYKWTDSSYSYRRGRRSSHKSCSSRSHSLSATSASSRSHSRSFTPESTSPSH
ncbi:unnamed protein product [Cuscuta epithymum]|uniref:RRM domain-containing protein n=1 Tax=Cuscuta epithymum TaxID=186058 RepID=A0AAV0F1H8_9ASTE|nr:unnamed protein product [Cuscuta epithymum]